MKKPKKIKILFHGSGEYANGLLKIHLDKYSPFLTMDESTYKHFREDLGVIRFRSEIEILEPKSMRTVDEYFGGES